MAQNYSNFYINLGQITVELMNKIMRNILTLQIHGNLIDFVH